MRALDRFSTTSVTRKINEKQTNRKKKQAAISEQGSALPGHGTFAHTRHRSIRATQTRCGLGMNVERRHKQIPECSPALGEERRPAYVKHSRVHPWIQMRLVIVREMVVFPAERY